MIEALRGDFPFLSFSRSLIENPNLFKYCGPLIEPFRGDEQKVLETFRIDEKNTLTLTLSRQGRGKEYVELSPEG